MEMRVIGAALSLVLVYLILSLLASHLSELFSGLKGGRGKTMERMVNRVFIGQENRVPAFWAYPPIAALAKGKERPSAIPPDLFAKAYLAVINDAVPPRETFGSPHDFVESLNRTAPKDSTTGKGKAAFNQACAASAILQLQKADSRNDWDAFEANLTTWIADVGDRIDGTYKRWKALGLLCTAGALSLIVDADSFSMINTFLSDDETRGAFSNIAVLIDDQHRGIPASQAASTPLSPSASPFERTSRAAGDFASAMGNIRSALKDPEIQAFGIDRDELASQCGASKLNPEAKQKLYASNSDTWVVLMPEIVRQANDASLGVSIDGADAETASGAGTKPGVAIPPREKSTLKRAADWWSPPAPAAPRPAVEGCEANRSRNPYRLSDCSRKALIDKVLACVTVVHSWVALAQPMARTESARKELSNAMMALQEGMGQLHLERMRNVGGAALAHRYLADPQQFETCAEQSGESRADFDLCLAQASQARLPFGWQNARLQLCESHAVRARDDEAEDARIRASTLQICPVFPSDRSLGIPRIESQFSPLKALVACLGVVLTTLMVSLGAPFWWSVLGKVADLRLAGGVRGLGDSGTVDPTRPTMPAPSSVSGNQTSKSETARPGGGPAGADTPTDGARNAFERTLRVQDVGRIQKVLQVPPTGRLDDATRDAIQRFLANRGMDNVRELTAQTYTMITTRQAPVATDPVVGPSGPWRRGQAVPADARSEIVQALKRVISPDDMLPTISPVGATFDDDLRARVVLYVALSDSAAFPDKSVTTLARRSPQILGQLDDSLRNRILTDKSSYVRSNPAWLDVAIGELGITEDGRESQSDPRVCAYIQALETLPVAGDQTPWCGAFVGWVMTQAQLLDANWKQDKALLMRALNWKDFGSAVDLSTSNPPNVPQVGDICVIQTATGHHVGIWAAGDSKQGWILGGNQGQSGSGGVTIVSWGLSPGTIVAVRRPVC